VTLQGDPLGQRARCPTGGQEKEKRRGEGPGYLVHLLLFITSTGHGALGEEGKKKKEKRGSHCRATTFLYPDVLDVDRYQGRGKEGKGGHLIRRLLCG